MARTSQRIPPPLVRRVLTAVHEATKDTTAPSWVNVGTLSLRIDRMRLDQAIALAVRSGWLKTAGDPPISLAITVAGLQALGAGAGHDSQG
ncbi:hypothetical protein SAMN02745126_02869 [Enhydrobacter aerosaccus]|uniref:Uncharacterized protein n=1 Tax=Enhydrobacter aerosaccus TaxID=225324 RepID=A0A1T4PK19_9HYPH|nr:hypothetical protein [Enhydrobacter aerosaccus]SJZ91842.1 hypothetical protein SAMN02745126_02869 [Enhydrobacter aerosaccus]